MTGNIIRTKTASTVLSNFRAALFRSVSLSRVIGLTSAFVFTALSAAANAAANDGTENVFVRAVIDGSASSPLPDIPQFQNAIKIVRQRTGSEAPLTMYAMRVARFRQQPQCGRVLFLIGQPATHTAWKDMGGQLNICENGDPPQRMCNGSPGKLVPAEAACSDGSRPVDTPEVAAAIQTAVAQGSITPDEFAKRESALRQSSGGMSTLEKGQ
jgi:hypothetical protein